MKIFMKLGLVILILFVLQACPIVPCNSETIILDPIPDSVLNMIVYKAEGHYALVHSEGTVINFSCTRTLKKELDCFECGRCSDCVEYEKLNIELNPDYPISDIQIWTYAHEMGVSDIGFSFSGSNFNFSIMDTLYAKPSMLYFNNDSFLVYKLGRAGRYSYNIENSLYADSLFFSKEIGIVKIVMSNGESFSYYEE